MYFNTPGTVFVDHYFRQVPAGGSPVVDKKSILIKMKFPGKPQRFWYYCGLCWLVYVTAYFGRVNLSITLPFLSDAYGYSKTSLGLVASGFFIAYAAGQLVNGVLGDRFNPRGFVSIGLAFAGISNILFGLSGRLVFLIVFWTFNGYFQSMLWGPLVRITAESAPPAHLHKAAMLLSSSTILGYFFSYTLIGKIVLVLGWKTAFFIPGVLLVLMALLWYWSLRNYVPGHSDSVDEAVDGTQQKVSSRTAKRGGTAAFFIRTGVWISALICMFQGSIKEGFNLWAPVFFSEVQAIPMDRVFLFLSLVPAMNFAGLALGKMVNRACKYQEKYTIVLFLSSALVSIILLRVVMHSSYILMDISFCTLLASIFAVNNMLTAFVPLNFRNERRVSAVAGFLDCAVYIGAAVAGPVAGFLVERFGWSGVINGWISVCVFALTSALLSRNYKKKKPGASPL
jgi:OPA family glycerol-3-phosphate transporter-like MFS transporter